MAPENPYAYLPPDTDDPPRTLPLALRCLLIWPLVFAAAVMATFIGVAVRLSEAPNQPFWLCGYIGSAVMYALLVGLPLSICARRRWYVRTIPALIAAVPVGWVVSLAGVWAVPGTLAIALSIAVETTGGPRRWITMARWLTTP